MPEKNKIILYISGGTMQGVFGAGVLSYLVENTNIYRKVEAVYSASAGVFVGAYFLANKTSYSSSIFYEDLTHDFIVSIPKFIWGFLQRLYSRFVYKLSSDSLLDAFDMEYLMKVITYKKPLDIKALQKQKIPLYAKLLNFTKKRIEYIDVREKNSLEILKTAVRLPPYSHTFEILNGDKYMDAANISVIDSDYLRMKHPKNKIVIILNFSPKRKLIRHKLKKFLEGKIMSYMFGKNMFEFYRHSERNLERNIESIKKDPNILLVYPPENNPTLSGTKDPEKLKITYRMGKDWGPKVAEFIEI